MKNVPLTILPGYLCKDSRRELFVPSLDSVSGELAQKTRERERTFINVANECWSSDWNGSPLSILPRRITISLSSPALRKMPSCENPSKALIMSRSMTRISGTSIPFSVLRVSVGSMEWPPDGLTWIT